MKKNKFVVHSDKKTLANIEDAAIREWINDQAETEITSTDPSARYIARIDPYEKNMKHIDNNRIITKKKVYVAYKGKDEKPKTTESGIGYFEDEIGWYFKQGELKVDTDE